MVNSPAAAHTNPAGGMTMEATLKQSDRTVIEVQVVEGSHIYLKQGDSSLRSENGQDVFIEWADAPEELRREALAGMERVAASTREASASLWGAITPA
jgi:hypothetical protein